jgi:hypothetical protein
MDASKTRIWSRTVLGLGKLDPAALGGAAQGPGPSAGASATSAGPGPGPAAPLPRPGSARAKAPAPLAPRPDAAFLATRIMPIERLLARPRTAGVKVIFDKLRRTRAAPGPGRGLAARLAGHVLLALLTVMAVAAWQLPGLLGGVRSRELSPARGTAPVPQPSAASAAESVASVPDDGRVTRAGAAPMADSRVETRAPSSPAARLEARTEFARGSHSDARSGLASAARLDPRAAHPERAQVDPRAGAPRARVGRAALATPELERRAVDLLIAGDYAAARRVYEHLAREQGSPAFREAARILAARRATE